MNCNCNSKDYANLQNAKYDSKSNTILYGINKNMKVLGVSDGTCNQINPIIYKNSYKCGLGVAGGNPCKKNISKGQLNMTEKFENTNKTSIDTEKNIKGCNLTIYINIIIIFLLVYLIYLSIKQ
jgi:hypothetical protein